MNAERIVSLAPSNTEILFALGLEDRIAGVTEFCNYPPGARLKDKVGGFSTVDIAKVVSLRPDLVLATDFHLESTVHDLRSNGLNVVVIKAKTLLDAPDCISQIGKITGQERKASELANDIESRIAEISERTRHLSETEMPRVCYICGNDPPRIARGTCPPNKLISIAGGANIGQYLSAKDLIDIDIIADRDPEVFITSYNHGETADLFLYVKNEPNLKNTSACRNNRVHRISADLVCRPGPRAIIGLAGIASFIHPDVFDAVDVNRQ
ncbi:MAG: helical backbone metal receptor [Dehalococcoidia bacterium]